MLPRLVLWLRRLRWIDERAILVQELPVNGRRVDLAVLSASGRLSAFELKLKGSARVLEQASYNRLSFDRSWAVVGAVPLPANVEVARAHGIGLLVISGDRPPLVVVRPSAPSVQPEMRRKVASRMRELEPTYVQ